jgi:hypothetical protein
VRASLLDRPLIGFARGFQAMQGLEQADRLTGRFVHFAGRESGGQVAKLLQDFLELLEFGVHDALLARFSVRHASPLNQPRRFWSALIRYSWFFD